MAKLKIQRCAMGKEKITPKRGTANIFEAVINPESYSHKFALTYLPSDQTKSDAKEEEKSQVANKGAAVPRFSKPEPQSVNFSLTLDGTGVVPDAKKRTVTQQIAQLRKVVYDYDGKEHEPVAVRITWGKGLKSFDGRLTAMGIDHTLFHPDGSPLRAKIDLSFIEAKTLAQEAKESKRSSPDLTHDVLVRQGDTLPLLCHRIYKSPTHYAAVAAFNDLADLRILTPGTHLAFPPLDVLEGLPHG